ncbi:MAG: hypothetical protein L0220_02855 [Acidobacteria bacterium]|nr:hypothetical protein [Acidobacteriota bacterium]
MPKPLFDLGAIVATPGALEALVESGERAETFLQRHVSGDWGELSTDDAEENKLSLKEGFRLLSAYVLSSGQRIWVLTEADRSVTTILLPEDY